MQYINSMFERRLFLEPKSHANGVEIGPAAYKKSRMSFTDDNGRNMTAAGHTSGLGGLKINKNK